MVAVFKKKTNKDKEEDAPPASPTAESYGGQPDVGGGADPSAARGGIYDKFSTSRRRLKENFAQRTGKEGVDNSEFEERAQRVNTLKEKVTKVRDAIKRQLDCSRALCLACADLGNACADADVRDVQFQNAQHQLDEEIRKKLDDAIVHALESLDKKLNPFQELEKMVMNRNRLKLDFDHYVRKVRDMKERPAADPSKLSSNEAKLTAARQRLQESTTQLYKAFGYYDAIGGRLCLPEIEMMKKAQQDFFGSASATVSVMSARDPKQVAAEVEADGKDGMNAPFTLPTSELETGEVGEASGLGSMRALGASMRDVSREDSPARTPISAYIPSSSAPWVTNPGNTGGSHGPAAAAFGSPGAGSGGSWWDRHSSGADTQQAGAWGSGGSGGGGGGGGGSVGYGVSAPPAPPVQERARVLYSYTATDKTEISLTEGEILTVVSRDQGGWWTGEKGGRKGLFPGNYVSII